MKEKQYFRQLIMEYAVDDAAVRARACAPVLSKAVAWKRAAAVAALCFVALIAAVFAIPSARAEVLSWFRTISADRYFANAPSERTPIPELDALTVTPAPDQKQPVQVTYVSDEPIWQEIAADFSVTLSETFFDGNTLYVAMDFDGLSGYPLYEEESESFTTAGAPRRYLLQEKGSAEELRMMLGNDEQALAPFLSGEAEYLCGPTCELILTLPDRPEVEYRSWMYYLGSAGEDAIIRAFMTEYGSLDTLDEAGAEALHRQMWDYFKENGAHVVAMFSQKPDAQFADENGIVRFNARFVVDTRRCERSEVKLDVDLGTVDVDVTAYKYLPQQRLVPVSSEPVALSGEVVFTETPFKTPGEYVNHTVLTDGATLSVKEGGSLNALGIRGVKLCLKLPESWSDKLKFAFATALMFSVQLDEDTELLLSCATHADENGDYILELSDEDALLFHVFGKISSIRLVPRISHFASVQIRKGTSDLFSEPETVATVTLGPNDRFDTRMVLKDRDVSFQSETVVFPEWAITLKIR